MQAPTETKLDDGLTGVQRAAKRLAAKLAANRLIPVVENYTRQQARVETRKLVDADHRAEAVAALNGSQGRYQPASGEARRGCEGQPAENVPRHRNDEAAVQGAASMTRLWLFIILYALPMSVLVGAMIARAM